MQNKATKGFANTIATLVLKKENDNRSSPYHKVAEEDKESEKLRRRPIMAMTIRLRKIRLQTGNYFVSQFL